MKSDLKKLRTEYREDDPKFTCNKVIDEFWDYSAAERQKAIKISKSFKNNQHQINKL